MPKSEKGKRIYRSAARSNQAAQTRAAVLAAAGRLSIRDGWTRTTVAAIAGEAGVSKETVYSIFGNKTALMKTVVTHAVRDNVSEGPLLEQPRMQAIGRESDQARQIELWAALLGEILSRVSPLMASLEQAAKGDPAASELYRALHRGRRENLRGICRAIQACGPLREGLSEDDAVTALWRLASPELFALLTDVEGLSMADYTKELSQMIKRALLNR